MNIFYKIVTFCYDLVLPRDRNVAICDKITRAHLEKYAHQVFIDMPFPCIAPLPYKNTLVKNMVHASKYHSHTHASNVLGEILSNFLSEELGERNMFNTFTEPVCTYIPLHKKRLRERGYNQAQRIARSVVDNLGFSENVFCEVLVRKKNTLSQSHTRNKTERIKNMEDAFMVHRNQNIQGKDIILIDDVVTTGATFASARNTLLKAGAREVLCVAAAH